jgi:hypothetical protein
MTLDTHEFIHRFLMHLLPQGFYRIRYYGLLTSPTRAKNIARIRYLLAVPLIRSMPSRLQSPEEPKAPEHACPCCGSRMRIIETFLPGQQPNASRSPQHSEALYVCTDPLMNTSRVHINKLALDARLPSVCGFREFVDAGGFISYGAYYPALFRPNRRQDSTRDEAWAISRSSSRPNSN